VRLWLGDPPPSAPPSRRCLCGRDADAEGRHFLFACPELSSRHARIHHHLAHLAIEALRAAPSWTDVVAEIVLATSGGAFRLDLRATHVTSSVVVWADASLTSPFSLSALASAAASQLRLVTAVAREAAKTTKYALALVGRGMTHLFTPLVWGANGCVGPATRRRVRDALGGPLREGARATLLRRVSVALWRSHFRSVAIGYSRYFGVAADPVGEEEGGIFVSVSSGANIGEFGGLPPNWCVTVMFSYIHRHLFTVADSC